jgi:hypothetical protein
MVAMARPTDPAPEGDDDLDDEALSWAGDEEQGRARPRLAPTGDGDPVGTAAEADDDEDLDLEERAPRDVAGGAVAVLAGILYLALTVGWIYSVQLSVTAAPSQGFPGPIVWQFGKFVAMIGAPLWFGAVIVLTRGRVGLRLGWAALGLGLLLPWPVLLELAG